jgi:hypothetical protein
VLTTPQGPTFNKETKKGFSPLKTLVIQFEGTLAAVKVLKKGEPSN